MAEDAEPFITVNGVELPLGQRMTMRVALENFRMWLAEPGTLVALGPIGRSYEERAGELSALLTARGRKPG